MMGNETSHKNDPVLKVLRYMLLSQGLELSDHNVIQALEDIITLAPWVSTGNLFSCGNVESCGDSGQRKGKTL